MPLSVAQAGSKDPRRLMVLDNHRWALRGGRAPGRRRKQRLHVATGGTEEGRQLFLRAGECRGDGALAREDMLWRSVIAVHGSAQDVSSQYCLFFAHEFVICFFHSFVSVSGLTVLCLCFALQFSTGCATDGHNPNPVNPSDCWLRCFFNSFIGNSTLGLVPMSRDPLLKVWAQSFTSDDIAEGAPRFLCPRCSRCRTHTSCCKFTSKLSSGSRTLIYQRV